MKFLVKPLNLNESAENCIPDMICGLNAKILSDCYTDWCGCDDLGCICDDLHCGVDNKKNNSYKKFKNKM